MRNKLSILLLCLILNSCDFRTSYSIFQKLNYEEINDIELSYFPYQKVNDTNYLKYKHYDINNNFINKTNINRYEILIYKNELDLFKYNLITFLNESKLKIKEAKSISLTKNNKYNLGDNIPGKFLLVINLKDTNSIYVKNNIYPKIASISASNIHYRVLGNAPKGFFQWDHPKEFCFSSEVLDNGFKKLYNELAKYKNKQMINSLKPSDNRDTLQLFPLLE